MFVLRSTQSSLALTAPSGTDAITILNQGARLRVGPGANSYFFEEGTVVKSQNSLKAPELISSIFRNDSGSTGLTFTSYKNDGASAVYFTFNSGVAVANAAAKLLSVQNNEVEKLYVDKDGGLQQLGGSSNLVGTTVSNYLVSSGVFYPRGHSILDDSNSALTIASGVTNGGAAVGIILDTTNALSTSGAKALSIRTGGSEKGFLSSAFRFEVPAGFCSNGGYGNSGVGGASQGLAFSGANTTLVSGGDANFVQIQSNSGLGFSLHNSAGVEVTTVGQGFILKSPDGTRYKITVANGGALSATAV